MFSYLLPCARCLLPSCMSEYKIVRQMQLLPFTEPAFAAARNELKIELIWKMKQRLRNGQRGSSKTRRGVAILPDLAFPVPDIT